MRVWWMGGSVSWKWDGVVVGTSPPTDVDYHTDDGCRDAPVGPNHRLDVSGCEGWLVGGLQMGWDRRGHQPSN